MKLYTIENSLYVSGKLPTYPSPKPTLTLTSHLRQNVGTERIFDQLKNLTGHFVHWHRTVQHFRSVNTEPRRDGGLNFR